LPLAGFPGCQPGRGMWWKPAGWTSKKREKNPALFHVYRNFWEHSSKSISDSIVSHEVHGENGRKTN